MPDEPVTPAAPVEPTEPVTPPTPAVTPVEPSETPEQTIARLESDNKKLALEATKSRVNARATAAEEARKELTQEFGKALGLIPDDSADPVKLLEQANASQADARRAQVELAVYRAADAAGGDPSALLDSRAFLDTLADADPNNAEAITAAITTAVAANPRLARPEVTTVPPGVGVMRPNPAQGSSAAPALGIDALIAAAENGGTLQERMRLKAQKAALTK